MNKATETQSATEPDEPVLAVGGDTPQLASAPGTPSLASVTASNSIWNAAAFAVSLLITFVTTPLYLHRLGESSYGVLILITSILTPLGLLDLGIGPATIKYVAESESIGNRAQSNNYIRSTLLFNLLVGIAGAILLVALARILTQSVFKIPVGDQSVAQNALYWVALRWLAMQVSNTFSGIPVALRRYQAYAIGAMLGNSSINIMGLVALYAGGDLAMVTQVQAWATIAATGMWILISRRLLPGIRIWPHWHPTSFFKTFRFGVWQMASNVGALFAHETERALLGILISATAVGLYNVAWSVHVAAFSLITALGQVLFPTFSHLQGLGRHEQSSRIILQATWSLGILSAGLYVPLFVFAQDLLTLWVGPAVAWPAHGVLQVLALAGLVASLFIVPNFYLMGIGVTKWLAWLAFLQGTITLLVSLLLIPSLGLNGAAWGVLASTLTHLVFVFLTWRYFLREWIRGRVFFSLFAGILVMSVGMGLILSVVRQAIHWTPTWVTFILAYGLCAGATVGAVVLTDALLPGGRSRRQEAKGLFVRLIPQLRSFLA